MKRVELGFTAFLLPLDLVGLLLAVYIANNLRIYLDILPLSENRFSSTGYEFLIWFFPILVFFFANQQLYVLISTRHRVMQLIHIITGVSSGSMVLFLVTLIGRTPFIASRYDFWSTWANNLSLLTIFYLWIMIVVIVTAFRWIYRSVINSLHAIGVGQRQVLIIGNTASARTLRDSINIDQSLGYKIVGFVDTDSNSSAGLPSLGTLNDLEEIIGKTHPDQIIEADSELSNNLVLSIMDVANERHIDFSFAPNLFEMLATNVTIDQIGGIPLLNLRRTPLDGWGKILKRFLDTLISLLLLIILSPIFIIIAVLVKLQDGGTVFFKHERVSAGKIFSMYKFRSMVPNAERLEDKLREKHNERDDGPLFKMKNDPRVTALGKLLRKSRIDELPQLFNVMTGDMSLVGPRPHVMKEIAMYQKHHRKVLAVKSGITGPSQLSGSSDLSFEDEVKLDTEYIEHWSLLKDVEIIVKTPFLILFKDRSGC